MKKAISLFLALVMLVNVFALCAFAEDSCGCGKSPIVFIDGINACDLIRDAGTENERKAFPFDDEAIPEIITENKDAVWDMLDGSFSEESERTVINAVKSLFADVEMNDDGTSKYNVSADWGYSAYDGHKEGGRFRLCYDWRLDFFETADKIKAYIDYVKELTGHDSVNIVGFSEGAAALTAYFSKYGYDGIDSVIWYCGAHNGVEMVGQLFSGKIKVNAGELTAFLHDVTDNTNAYQLLSFLIQGITDIGVTGGMLKITEKIVKQLIDDGAIREIILSSFGKMPALWGMVGDEYYEAAKDELFPTNADKERCRALIEKIDRYHYEVQVHSREIMEEAKERIGRVAVISKYDRPLIPVIENSALQADGTIETMHTSCGATTANFGRMLPYNYVQAANDGHDHLSPDRVIDASTAHYPDYTWFIKHCEHSEGPEYIDELIRYIAFADHQVDVFENPDFPQYVIYHESDETVTPLTGPKDGQDEKKFIVIIKEWLWNVFDTVVTFFSSLFKVSFNEC
ncbi:MAG: hypothetical protein IJS90_01785 [Clostridia bacterium]|nr:hypothetical protein [Clostridia bacterium]